MLAPGRLPRSDHSRVSFYSPKGICLLAPGWSAAPTWGSLAIAISKQAYDPELAFGAFAATQEMMIRRQPLIKRGGKACAQSRTSKSLRVGPRVIRYRGLALFFVGCPNLG